MEAVFQKMNETKRRRNAAATHKTTIRKRMKESCSHIIPETPYEPDIYIDSCDLFPVAKRQKCEEYRKCAEDAIKNIDPVPEFNIEEIVPDYKFPLYPGMNIDVRQNTLADFDSTDVLRQIQQIQAEWPWPLDETTLIVMLGAGNSVTQNFLMSPGVKEELTRPHTLVFNIDPTFKVGGSIENTPFLKKEFGIDGGHSLILDALANNNHIFWQKLREHLGAVAPPTIRDISDKVKILEFILEGGRTLTYVYVKSFANIYLVHSFFWPKGERNVRKVFLDYLKSGVKVRFKKYLLDKMYDKVLVQSGDIRNVPGIRFENNYNLTTRLIEGGVRRKTGKVNFLARRQNRGKGQKRRTKRR